MHIPDDWVPVTKTDVLTILSLVFVGFTLIVNSIQAREVARQAKLQTDVNRALLTQQSETGMQNFTNVLLQYPNLRAYFYGNAPAPSNEPDRAQTLLLAEMLADHISMIVQLSDSFTEEYRNAWFRYFREITASSPTLQLYWKQSRQWYTGSSGFRVRGCRSAVVIGCGS